MASEQQLIRQLAAKYGVDPRAALAIASVEGGFHGSVGDNGTSFGPFQLHEGGALPHGRGAQWANSRAGIDYAMRHIASVAHGLHGRQAIAAISSRFERPADVPAEIAKAMSRYGGGFGGGGIPLQLNQTQAHPSFGGGNSQAIQTLIQQLVQNHPTFSSLTPQQDPLAVRYGLYS